MSGWEEIGFPTRSIGSPSGQWSGSQKATGRVCQANPAEQAWAGASQA